MSKYKAIPTIVDGVRFASKLEAKRYQELRLLEKSGNIYDLRHQIKFPLHVGTKKIGSYICDFDYMEVIDHERGASRYIVEDVKSVPTITPLYRWKKKHLLAEYGIEIREITK